jgi:drug/metabolite transporter (DMT)-like permease
MDKLLAVLGMLANAGNDLIFKKFADRDRGRNAHLFFTLQALFIIPLCVISILIYDRTALFHLVSILYAIPVGIFTYLLYFLALKSLVAGDISVNVTIYRLNFVISSVLAVVLLNEALTVRKIAGLALCLLTILLFFQANRRGPAVGGRGYRYSISACLIGGGLNILIKTALNDGVMILPFLLYRYITAACFGLIILLIRRGSWRVDPALLRISLFSGIVILLGLFFIFAALQIGEVILVIPITQLGFVFAGAAAFLFFKEKLHVLKVVGILLAVASILVIG